MAAELRHIIFSRQEVIEAVLQYMLRTGERTPQGVVTGMTVNSKAIIGIVLEITEDVSNKVHTLNVAGDKLTAALILFCKTTRIPLPYKGQKKLQMFGNNLSMIVSKNIPVENIKAAQELLLDA